VALFAAGCVSAPQHTSAVIRPGDGEIENPVLVFPGQATPSAYADVFERVIDVLDDSFELAYFNRYDGWIISAPRVAPGLEQPWKIGSPSVSERLLASLQTIRHIARVRIEAAPRGGYFVTVVVEKELEDLAQPIKATAGGSSFREITTVARQYEVVETAAVTKGWIPKGRDTAFEQAILRRIRECQQ
jgi:hypothetical protein